MPHALPKTKPLKILLHGRDPGELPIIPVSVIDKLPASLISNLGKIALHDDWGDFSVLRIKASVDNDMVLRVGQFITAGEYYPFKDKTREKPRIDILHIGTKETVTYNHAVHESVSDFVTTPDTHDLFRSEVELYAVSVQTGYRELQDTASRHIRFHYPIFAKEVQVLIEILARELSTDLATTDPQLATFIRKRYEHCRNDATLSAKVLPFLRSVVDPTALFHALIAKLPEDDLPQLLPSLQHGLGPVAESDALFEVFIGTKQASKAPVLANPPATNPSSAVLPSTNPPQTTPRPPLASTSSEAESIFRAMRENRILVAGTDGYGTLRHSSDGSVQHRLNMRNENFRFRMHDLLVVDPEPGHMVNSPVTTLVVRDVHGDVGEVFKGLGFVSLLDFITTHRTSTRASPPLGAKRCRVDDAGRRPTTPRA